MFYALANDKIDTGDLRFQHELVDIETLNQRALAGDLEISAVSIHAFTRIADRYALLASGCSMGDRYGPKLIAKKPICQSELANARIAVPGKLTTAYLALQLCLGPKPDAIVLPFDQIMPAVLEGSVDVGLIIHEGQLYYPDQGFHQILDLGQWWYQSTGLPLPLGGNVVRKDLGAEIVAKVARLLKASIQYALDHRDEALAYALQYARGLDRTTADKFVGMYVNDWTLDYGDIGRRAVQTLLDRGAAAGLTPPIDVEFAG